MKNSGAALPQNGRRIKKYFKIFGEYDFRPFLEKWDTGGIAVAARSNYLDNLISIEFADGCALEKFFGVIKADICRSFGGGLYAEKNISPEKAAVKLLAGKGKTLSVAESLTGGMVCSLIVGVPGASAVLYEGIVSYSNQAKARRLFVPHDVLDVYGAVSEETGRAMCAGAVSNADYALSTTGLAGPGGNTLTTPLGLCYISVGNKKRIQTQKYVFGGGRYAVRRKAAHAALFALIKFAGKN